MPTEEGTQSRPDWRKADDYRHLLALDRQHFAHELLERDPEFVAARAALPPPKVASVGSTTVVDTADCAAIAKWGLRFRECVDAQLRVLAARHQPACATGEPATPSD